MGGSTRDARWLVMGPLLAMAGYAFGVALVGVSMFYVLNDRGSLPLTWYEYLRRAFVLGLAMAVYHLVLGLAVGLVLTFLVGAARGRGPRRRAMVGTAVAYAVGTVVVLLVAGPTIGLVAWPFVTVAAVLAAGRLHDRLASRSPVGAPAH